MAPIPANGRHPLVVVGASAGGVEALTVVVDELPGDGSTARGREEHLPT